MTVSVDVGMSLDRDAYFSRAKGFKVLKAALDDLMERAAREDIGGLDPVDALDVEMGALDPIRADSLSDALRVNVDRVLQGYRGEVRATYAPAQAKVGAMQPVAHLTVAEGEVRLDRIELGFPEGEVETGLRLHLDDNALRYAGALSMARAQRERAWDAVELRPNEVRMQIDRMTAREAEPKARGREREMEI
jgi:hypothetical protein